MFERDVAENLKGFVTDNTVCCYPPTQVEM